MTPRDKEHERQDPPKPFVEHLDDLRSALFWSVVSYVVAVCAIIPLIPRIIEWLKTPIRNAGQDPAKFLKIFDVTGSISLAMQVVMWGALLLSMPFILFFIARFVFPGLTKKERHAVMGAMGFAALLFALGVCVGYFMLLPVTLQWLFALSKWMNLEMEFVQLNSYISFLLKMLLGFGLTFEFPVVVVTLGAIGLVSSRFLADKRRHVVVLLLIVAAVVTPTVDPVSQTMLAAPLYVLYELCIWIVWFMERRAKRNAAAG
jgi:sec-independent protein translocase protein TatC